MALRNQPYLPLYVDDFMNDEKLRECSAESTGVYIRLMCLMHKSEEYGVVLLRQKDKQNSSICQNFAIKLAYHLPYTQEVILQSLNELIANDVIQIDGDKILQKRMVRDNYISDVRSDAGRSGGFAKAKGVANELAKEVANTGIGNTNENGIGNGIGNGKQRGNKTEIDKGKDDVDVSDLPAEIRGAITEFIKHRKNMKRPLDGHALMMFIQLVKSMKLSDAEKVAMINKSIMNGWTGLVEPNKKKGSEKGNFDQRQYTQSDYDNIYEPVGVST